MFFQVIEVKRDKKSYRYLRILETYRQGARVKQQTLANLGNFDAVSLEKIGGLIQSLFKIWRLKLKTSKKEDYQLPPVLPFKLRGDNSPRIANEHTCREEPCSFSSNAIW